MAYRRPKWYLEVPLLVGGYLMFGLVRAWIDRGPAVAAANAETVQRLERALHIAVEYPLNHALVGNSFAMYATGYFYRLCVLAVPAVLIWLYLRRPEHYRQLRTVLVVMTLLDLLLVWLYPETPPRMALNGIVDYMAAYDILGGAGAREAGRGLNIRAAMPSMHIAWTTWCAYAVWTASGRRRAAWPAWLFPLATALTVLVTGHHYVLDIVGGVVLVATVVQAVRLAARRTPSTGDTAPAAAA